MIEGGPFGVIGSFEFGLRGFLHGPQREVVQTPHGAVEAALGDVDGQRVALLTRPGRRHPLSPNAINHRANVAALAELGVKEVVATGMVGSLRASLPVGTVVLLDQFLDFSRHHPCTYYEESDFAFLDFTEPFCGRLRRSFRNTAAALDVALVPHGCYVSTEGPRYETRAEVRMFGQLGGDVIGQTVATECVMAREAGLCYAVLSGVVNAGAGLSDEELSAEAFLRVRDRLLTTMEELIRHVIAAREDRDPAESACDCNERPHRERQRRAEEPEEVQARAAAYQS